jgi:hypothetical protein
VPWKCVLPLKRVPQVPRILGTGDRGPKSDRSRPRSVPVNAPGSGNAIGAFRCGKPLERIVGKSSTCQWWLNRKDREGNNLFEGGFLGLDNIGVFDRSNRSGSARATRLTCVLGGSAVAVMC